MIQLLTCCGIGKISFAPGTWGSLATVLFASLVLWLFGMVGMLFVAWLLLAVSTAALYYFGEKFATAYITQTGQQDPGLIVIDEWVGQMIAILVFMAGLYFSGQFYNSFSADAFTKNYGLEVLAVGGLSMGGLFLLFRFFDIVKPWHAGWADSQLEGGRGVMLDDVFAGLYAGLAALAICWFWVLVV